MNDLSKYIYEAIVKGHITKKPKDRQVFKFPVFTSNGDGALHFERWKDVQIPKGEYFVWKDKYHKCLHLGKLSDISISIGADYDDYEDFSEKDVIAAFNTLKEAAEYVNNDMHHNRYYDSKHFINGVLNDEIDDRDYIECDEDIIDTLYNRYDIDNMDDIK